MDVFACKKGINFGGLGWNAVVCMFEFPSNSYVDIFTPKGDGISRWSLLEVLGS